MCLGEFCFVEIYQKDRQDTGNQKHYLKRTLAPSIFYAFSWGISHVSHTLNQMLNCQTKRLDLVKTRTGRRDNRGKPSKQ